jgi:hypothetical protein
MVCQLAFWGKPLEGAESRTPDQIQGDDTSGRVRLPVMLAQASIQ